MKTSNKFNFKDKNIFNFLWHDSWFRFQACFQPILIYKRRSCVDSSIVLAIQHLFDYNLCGFIVHQRSLRSQAVQAMLNQRDHKYKF